MRDISGFGLRVRVIASVTFPQGFEVTAFADDADPFDVAVLNIAETAMGLNGDLLTWSKGAPITVTLNVVPTSEDDRNLQILFEANRTARGKRPARDVVTLVGIYPDGRQVTASPGAIISGTPFPAVASAGRMKSRPYGFAFENKAGVGA